MIRNLLIDWDNTIWDLSANSAKSLSMCFSDYGLRRIFGSCDTFIEEYHKANDALWARYRNGEIDRNYLATNRFYNTFMTVGYNDRQLSDAVNNAYLRNVENISILVPHAMQCLEELKGLGYRLIIITNGFRDVQNRKLRNSGISHLIDYMILSDSAGALKPSERFFDYVFETTGAKAGESIVIGDDPEADIAGAVGYGLRCVYLNRFGKPCPYPADYEIDSLIQLPEILKSID